MSNIELLTERAYSYSIYIPLHRHITSPHNLRRHKNFTILNQLVVAGPPGYLALAALFVGHFAVLARSYRAQIWLEMAPDCRPHFGHSGYRPANLEPDTFEASEVLDLAHHQLHLRADLPTLVKVANKREI